MADYTLVYIIIAISIIAFIGIAFYILYWHDFRHHIRCMLCVPFGNTFRIIKLKWVLQTQQTFNDKSGKKNHAYNINLTKAVYNKRNNPILYYEINKTDPIDFTKNKNHSVSSNLYDTVLRDASANEVLNESQSKSMLLIIGILVIIIVVIGLYSQYQLGVANDKVIALTKHIADILANVTKTGGVIIK
jgi:hypothetical protein